jgi:periplasmic divalent cation tolerance protein
LETIPRAFPGQIYRKAVAQTHLIQPHLTQNQRSAPQFGKIRAMSDALVILCTCPDDAIAGRLARSLVEQRLAACVNIVPAIRSIYSWQGELCDDKEVLLVIKTLQSRFPELEAWLREHHPYDVPEVVALPAEHVSADYLAWIASGVSP